MNAHLPPRGLALLLAALLLPPAVVAGQAPPPTPERIDLFEAGRGGYAIYRIPGIVATARGTLLAYCEARKEGASDWGTIDILMRRSEDGGRSWSDPRRIAEVPGPHAKNPVALARKAAQPGDVTTNNPVMIADRESGAVHLIFCYEYMRCFYSRSDDDGRSFSAPAEITRAFDAFRDEYDWKVLATGPGHGIRLRNGRLLVPVWLSTGTEGNAHKPSVNATITSDDAGRSWHRGAIVSGRSDPVVNPSETVAEQLSDGRVMLNIRSQSGSHRRAVAFSGDGATGWTLPAFDEALKEPICFGSLCRLTATPADDRDRLLFVNPDNLDRADGRARPGQGRDRRNLTVRLSYDEGRTWAVSKPLEPGVSGYADLAVGADGTIYCLYERGGLDGKTATQTGALTLARFTLDWLTDGRDRLPPR